MDKIPVPAILRMRDHLKFSPPLREGDHGFFIYRRLYTSLFKFLPAGEQEARASARRVIARLNQAGGALASEASYKLAKSYLSGHCEWLTAFDKQEPKLTFMPVIAILSLHNESSGVRICLVPTRVFNSLQNKPLSYNSCVTDLPATFPKPLRFALQDQFCTGSLQADIQSMFNSVRYDLYSSLQTLTFALRTPSGRPTFSLDQAADNTLHCLRSTVLEWGHKDAPHCAQQALAQCVQVYKSYHPDLEEQPLANFMLRCLQDIIDTSIFMDDIGAGVTLTMLREFAQLSGQTMPLPPCACTTETCDKILDQDKQLVSCPNAVVSPELWTAHCDFVKIATEQLLLRLAQTMCRALNFSGFRLKFLRSQQCDQSALDNLVKEQTVKVPKESDIGVTRPSPQVLKETICKLKTNSNLHFSKGPESLPKSHVQLSHCYDKNQVALNIKHLAITCLVKNSRKKSLELYSYTDYTTWKNEVKPVFTKRSLFSLLHANFCFTGKWLSLYKTMLKILIRSTLQQNPEMTWDESLDADTVKRMELAIQLYFALTQQVVVKPENFNSYLSIYYIYLFTDASSQILAHSITILAVTNLEGRRVIKSQHLILNSAAAHVAALSVPQLELQSLMRGVQALFEVTEALEGIGVQVAPHHRRIGVDSKVCLAQARSPATNFVKRVAHVVAKIQLLLSDLKMSPFTELGYQNQSHPGVTFIPDFLTRVNWTSSVGQLMTTYHKIMDTTWMNENHPLQMPGWDPLVALPRLSDQEWMQVGGVLEGEVDVFKKSIMMHTSSEDHVQLLKSAATRVCEYEQEGEGDNGGDHSCGHEWLEEDYVDLPSEEDELEVDGQGEGARQGGKAEEKDTPAAHDVPSVKARQGGKAEESHTSAVDDVHDVPGVPGAPVPQLASWKAQMQKLIARHHSRGLGWRGVIPILGYVYKFVTNLKEAFKLGAKDRRERQQLRLSQRKREMGKAEQPGDPSLHLHDEHFNWCQDLNLALSPLGNFDCLWNSTHNSGENLQETQALQHLLNLFHSSKRVRGFTHQSLQATGSNPIKVLQGRRQRDFRQDGFTCVRLRPVQESSTLESLLLWAAHRYSRGRGTHAALNGLTYLNIYINQAERKLRKINSECTSCNRRRASLQKTTHKVRIQRPGPTDNLLQAARWLEGSTIVQCDLHGPVFLHLTAGAPAIKNYIVCFLELPLKRLTSVMVQSLSAADLLLALETYATQRGRACDLFYSDFGANLSRFHDTFSEMEPIDYEEELAKSRAWRRMLTATYDTKTSSSYCSSIRFSQGRHACLAAVEKAQYEIKAFLHSYNIHRRETPLTFHQWTFLLSCVSQAINSRPLLISEGRVFSPDSILRLLGEVGGGDGQHGLTFHTQGARHVTYELERRAEEIKEMRGEVADLLLSHLVKKYFLEIPSREQSLRSQGTDNIAVNDVFLCPRLFKETSNVTASLIQLHQRGASHNHGIFKRTSTHAGKRHPYVGRGFQDLFFVARGSGNNIVGAPNWQAEDLPSFQLSQVAPEETTQLREYDTFEAEEEKSGEEVQVASVKRNPHPSPPHHKTLSKKGARGKEKGKEEEECEKEGELGEQPAPPTITRSGRVVRRPERLQL